MCLVSMKLVSKHLERLGLQNKDGMKVSAQLNNMFSSWVICSQT